MHAHEDLLVRHKLDVEDYHRMAEAGIFEEGDRVELINGEIIDMVPIGWDHAATVNGLTKTLVLSCGERGIVSVQNPLRLDRYNEPEPDFVVYRPRADGYREGGPPGPLHALLVVEVADSALRFDRRVKLPIYARFGIQEFWIVNLDERILERHSRPQGEVYLDIDSFGPADTLSLILAPDIAVALAGLFG